MAIKENKTIQQLLDEVPATSAEAVAEAYILGMREIELLWGSSPALSKVIAFTVDETNARLETRKLYLKEEIDF